MLTNSSPSKARADGIALRSRWQKRYAHSFGSPKSADGAPQVSRRALKRPRSINTRGCPTARVGEVRKLLRSVKGSRPVDLRARAVLSLLWIYGLRSGEVSRLLLSDFDWREEVFVVNYSKKGGSQRYPLISERIDALQHRILKYQHVHTLCLERTVKGNEPQIGDRCKGQQIGICPDFGRATAKPRVRAELPLNAFWVGKELDATVSPYTIPQAPSIDHCLRVASHNLLRGEKS